MNPRQPELKTRGTTDGQPTVTTQLSNITTVTSEAHSSGRDHISNHSNTLTLSNKDNTKGNDTPCNHINDNNNNNNSSDPGHDDRKQHPLEDNDTTQGSTLPTSPSPTRPRQRQRRRHRTNCIQRNLPFRPKIKPVPPDAIPPDVAYGDGVETKEDGIYRLAYGNIDGFNLTPYNNPKANSLKSWLRSIDADFFAGNEAKINWKLMPPSGRLPEIFRTENALRTVAAYNTNENIERRQYGGTFQLTFGELASRVVDTGVDDSGLGRFAWTKFQGRNGHVARLVSVYVPCYTARSGGELTVMNQQRRYFEDRGILTCPRVILLQDLRTVLQEWREHGERLISLH